MLPKELLSFYTHLAADPDAPQVTVNLSTFYRDDDKPREFKYKTDQQGYSLLYSVGGAAQQTVEVFPPYRYTYGINRLQGSTSTDYAFNYPVQSDPIYSQATVGFTDVVVAPENILERACGTTASVSITGLTSETLYIGNFINESRDVIFTSNPISLNVEGLLFLYVVRSRDGLDVYQPGIDYTFDPVYQAITFNEPPELYTPIVIEIGIATLDGSYKVINANGTHSLPPAFSYGVAITGAEGTYSEFATNITWTSVIDDSEPNTNYVLSLSDESGCKTLASSGSNNIVITDVNALVHRTTFKDFTDSIRTSTPVPVESTASLADTIAYEEVKIKSASVPGYNESRIVTFDQTVDNPVELASINTEAYIRAGSYESGIYRSGSIRSLPKALGVSEVEDSVLNNNQAPATITPTFSLLVPANDNGFFGRYELTGDMDLMNPISAAWGLLLAASYKDSDVILLNLKALVYQAKQRGWIKLEDGAYVIDKAVSAGLPIYFSATNSDYAESFKEVGSNAFLGLAACLSVLSLTDDEVRAYYALQGSDSDFYSELLLTLEAMALFVANGVSRVTWYAAYKEDAGLYSYDQPSLSATIYADIFLSYLLSLRYNSIVHYVAAKLDYNLSLLPEDLESPFYEQFYGDDNINRAISIITAATTPLPPPPPPPLLDFTPLCALDDIYLAALSLPFAGDDRPRETDVATFALDSYEGNILPISSFVLDDFAFIVKPDFNVQDSCIISGNTRTIYLPSDTFIIYDGNNPNYANGAVDDLLTTNYVFNGDTVSLPGGLSISLSIAIESLIAIGVTGQPHNTIALSTLQNKGYISGGVISFKIMHVSHGGGELSLSINVPKCL